MFLILSSERDRGLHNGQKEWARVRTADGTVGKAMEEVSKEERWSRGSPSCPNGEQYGAGNRILLFSDAIS